MDIDLELSEDQLAFFNDDTSFEKLFCAGLSSGKSYVGAANTIKLSLMNPGLSAGVIEPNWSDIKDVAIANIRQQLDEVWHIPYEFNKATQEVLIKPSWQAPSLIQPKTAGQHLRGRNWSHVWADELDTYHFTASVDPAEFYREIQQRVRHPEAKKLQIISTSTPEGYRFLFNHFVAAVEKDPSLKGKRTMYKGSTFRSPYASDHFIHQILGAYPKEKAMAYLNGDFVNFSGTSVYGMFNRELNTTDLTIDDFKNQVLHISCDFNKGVNATNVCVVRNNHIYAIDEIYGKTDAEAVAQEIKRRYPHHTQMNAIRFYPDGQGYEGIQTLRRHFPENGPDLNPNFRYHARNPEIAKRVTAVNFKLKSPAGNPEAFVNPRTCPHLFKSLTEQAYDKNGNPDKASGLDHSADAFGYFIYWNWPAQDRSPRASLL